MSRELNKILLTEEDMLPWAIEEVPRTFAENVAIKYAEKVAVAFAEWKEDVHDEDGYYHFWNNGNIFNFNTITDLYQYFIEKIYNK